MNLWRNYGEFITVFNFLLGWILRLLKLTLTSKGNCSSIRKNLITKIKSLVFHDKGFLIKHVHKEANSCGDALANNGIELQEEFCLFDACPPFINHFFESDLGCFLPPVDPGVVFILWGFFSSY